MRLVVIESPLSAPTPEERARNRRYAAACMADSLRLGEAPYASHLLYDQPGILDDQVPGERRRGMEAGFAWGTKADARVVYWNLGVSAGMEEGLRLARIAGQVVEFRRLANDWDEVWRVNEAAGVHVPPTSIGAPMDALQIMAADRDHWKRVALGYEAKDQRPPCTGTLVHGEYIACPRCDGK